MSGVVLHFDRLDTGELVAIHTHRRRSVAAIVHPPRPPLVPTPGKPDATVRNWSLAGDLLDRTARPHGSSLSESTACVHACIEVAHELGIIIDGYEVEAP